MLCAQVDGVETVVSVEQAIQNQNFPNAGMPVLVGSNLDEGSTFMCVGDRTTILALAIVNPISPTRMSDSALHLSHSLTHSLTL